jgi:hypothetical protein
VYIVEASLAFTHIPAGVACASGELLGDADRRNEPARVGQNSRRRILTHVVVMWEGIRRITLRFNPTYDIYRDSASVSIEVCFSLS